MNYPELILAAFMAVCLMLAGSSRLLHCIRLVAVQGLLLGLLPLVMWDWGKGLPHWEMWLSCAVNGGVKFILLPIMLVRSMRLADVKRELEPLVGYSWSIFLVAGAGVAALWFSASLHLADVHFLVIPAAVMTMFTGLFIIISRRKAITQSLGFLAFENGIALFGTGMKLEYGFFVEMGILLDVLVLVLVMGIAVFQISREFEHIDADRLNMLKDTEPEGGEVK